MESVSASMAFYDGKLVTGGFSSTRSSNAEVFFVVSLNNLLKIRRVAGNLRYLCVTDLCEGNSPISADFPQRQVTREMLPFDDIMAPQTHLQVWITHYFQVICCLQSHPNPLSTLYFWGFWDRDFGIIYMVPTETGCMQMQVINVKLMGP